MPVKLNESTVKSAVPPATGSVSMWDSEVVGLMLRVHAKGAKSFAFTYRTAHEQMAQTGQMVDFIHLSKVTLVRPDKLRLEVTGDVRNTILTYDGKVVTLLDPIQKFFTQLAAPPSITGRR